MQHWPKGEHHKNWPTMECHLQLNQKYSNDDSNIIIFLALHLRAVKWYMNVLVLRTALTLLGLRR